MPALQSAAPACHAALRSRSRRFLSSPDGAVRPRRPCSRSSWSRASREIDAGDLGRMRRRRPAVPRPRVPGGDRGERLGHHGDRLAAAARGASSRTARSRLRADVRARATPTASMSSTRAGPTPIERAGGRYYPKLQVAVPFTPVPGPRLLLAPGAGRSRRAGAGAGRRRRQLDVSSLHVTFCARGGVAKRSAAPACSGARASSTTGRTAATELRRLSRHARSASARRSARSAREVAEQGLEPRGADRRRLTPDDLGRFYPFYRATVDKRWGNAYLTARFFRCSAERWPTGSCWSWRASAAAS